VRAPPTSLCAALAAKDEGRYVLILNRSSLLCQKRVMSRRRKLLAASIAKIEQ